MAGGLEDFCFGSGSDRTVPGSALSCGQVDVKAGSGHLCWPLFCHFLRRVRLVTLSQSAAMEVFPVPLHKLMLECDLVKGEVRMAVRPALPIVGTAVILGKGLAGSRVLADVSLPPVLTFSLSLSEKLKCFPQAKLA